MRRHLSCFCLSLAVVWGGPARADLIEYILPGGDEDSTINLQGKLTVHQGATVTLDTKFGKLHFGIKDVKIHKVPTLVQQFGKQLTKAKSDANAVMEAARWALRHGMLEEFYAGVDKALQIDPKSADAKRVVALRGQMKKDLGDSAKPEDEVKKFVNRPQMKIKTSNHFVLLYDTPDKAEKGRKPQHEERLELLEKVYESFMLTFFSRGVPLEIPTEKLKVVLFNQHQDYLDFSTRLSPVLKSTAGFYMNAPNTSFFFIQGTNDMYRKTEKAFKEISELAKKMVKAKDPGAKHIVRVSKTLDLLLAMFKEGADVEVVSHECTHQLAANTGLFPRNVRVPKWVHEGLAAYFECPSDGAWSGIGAVNKRRLAYYRVMEPDRAHSNIDFIVSDQLFDFAYASGSINTIEHGYGQAWALTHFLVEKHLDQFIRYYKELGEMPPDVRLSPQMLNTLFDRAFPEKEALDGEWRGYMRKLKTDIQMILDD